MYATALPTLRARIRASGRLQRDVAAEIGVTESAFSNIIAGRIAAWPLFVVRCCELFGTDEAELFPEVFDPASPARSRVRGVA